MTPTYGELQIAANLTIQVNEPTDPIDVHLFGEIIDVISITEDCGAWVDPFDIQVNGSIGLQIVGGQLDATVPPLDWAWTLTGDDIQLSSCGTVDTIDDFLEFFGVDIFQIILDAVEPEIESAIADITSEVEAPIEEAFAAASISEEIDIGVGVPLTVEVFPSDIEIEPAGVRLHLDGSIDAGVSDPCVAEYGITESLATPSLLDDIGGPIGMNHHVAVFADDDLLNQALFSIWNAGLLCQVIDDSTGDLPVGINTSLLGLIAPGVYDELFPTTEALSIVTKPTKPPIGSMLGPNDVNIDVADLGLDFAAELDGRMTRVLRVDLATTAGVNLDFDGTSGALDVGIVLEGDDLQATVTVNEFVPDANSTIEDSFTGLFDTLVGPLLGEALSDLNFEIPAFEGFGLVSAQVDAAGSAGDRVGLFGTVGPVSYTSTGCSDSGGCDSTSGCSDTSCSSGRMPGRALLLVLPLVLAALRRRR